MRVRTWLVRLVFLMLAFIAGGGILAAFSRGWEVPLRVMGTGLVGCIGAGICMTIAVQADRPMRARAGLTAILGVALLMVLVLTAIWLGGGPGTLQEGALFAALFVGVAVPAATLGAGMTSSRANAAVGVVLLVLAAGSLLAGLPAVLQVLQGDWTSGDASRFAGTSPFLSLTALCAGTSLLRRSEEAWVGRGGVGVLGALLALAALGLTLNAIWWSSRAWGGGRAGQTDVATIVLLWSGALSVAAWRAARFAPLRGHQSLLRHSMAGLIMAAGATGAAAVLTENEQTGALSLALGVAAACAAIGLLLMARINGRAEYQREGVRRVRIEFGCPRCRRTMSAGSGESACGACGLRIRIDMEPPRCRRCGQMVSEVPEPQCPECGEPLLLAGVTA